MAPTVYAIGAVRYFTYFISLTVTLKVTAVLSLFYR